jgi:hypothetical protein
MMKIMLFRSRPAKIVSAPVQTDGASIAQLNLRKWWSGREATMKRRAQRRGGAEPKVATILQR